jgi:GDP-L-fucose synthase
MEKYDSPEHINVGTGTDKSIKEIANLVALESGFHGETLWDTSKPDGTLQKVLDVTKLNELGWSPLDRA